MRYRKDSLARSAGSVIFAEFCPACLQKWTLSRMDYPTPTRFEFYCSGCGFRWIEHLGEPGNWTRAVRVEVVDGR